MVDVKDKEIEKLKKELKFANDQLSKTLKLYDNAKAETLKAVSARSEFLSKLSHEAKTPMNALIGYADIINSQDVDGEFFEFSMGIKSATNRLLNFFNDIIELSRIESGLTTLIEDEYRTEDSIKYVVNNVRYDIESKGLELRVKMGENVPTILYGDKVHIHQIILNLLSNAIKFTDKGYISIELDAKETDVVGTNGKKMVEVSFSVEDTGMGIKKEDSEKLFVAFSQFNSNSPYANQGAGLGLIICKYFSNLMKGDIYFESEYGKGSKFTCKILQEVVDDTPLDGKYVADNVFNSNMKLSAPDAKVLLVDDSRVNLSVASGLLKWFDIDAITAGGGIEAVELTKKEKFDIIFMDHMMPDLDGVEASKIIRENDEYYKEVPIVALTANTTDEARIMFKENGLTDFLAKPVEIDSFKAVLERWLPREKVIRDLKKKALDDEKNGDGGIDKDKFADRGILVNKGLVYFAGNMDAYVETLKLVYKEGCENVKKLSKYLEIMDLNNYAIIAHSVKSVMVSIGATVLSEEAKNHELAAKANDAKYVSENGKGFIGKYDEIIKFVGENIKLENEEEDMVALGDASVADISRIKKIIDEAIADIEDFESDAAVEKLNELKESL